MRYYSLEHIGQFKMNCPCFKQPAQILSSKTSSKKIREMMNQESYVSCD